MHQAARCNIYHQELWDQVDLTGLIGKASEHCFYFEIRAIRRKILSACNPYTLQNFNVHLEL